jgi:UDP-glucose 4-epimerase
MSEAERARKILVTGGAGFIGSHIVDALVARGDRVAVLDDLSSGSASNVHPQAELHELDIRSAEAAALVERFAPEVLIHQAAQMDVRKSTEDPAFDAQVNVLGLLNLLAACVRAGVSQVLFASTGGAIYGDQEHYPAAEDHPTRPLSPYGVSKLAGERYLYYFHRARGLNAVCLRYANVYGERQNPAGEAGVVAIFLGRLLAGQACRINGDGRQTRDYIHVSDVVRANLAAIGRAGFDAYNVGTGLETSVLELYHLLAGQMGVDLAPEFGPAKPGEQQRSSLDPGRMRRDLGLAEPLRLETGLARTADWFRRQRAVG